MCNKLSPRYTTGISELPVVKA
ncbi:DUF4113 domain-containing protein [Aeromonas hydrophila]|nr:DUF4113 domain-containing protein [Aeromonas hydrophila]MBW3771020.1 DUF4113 domain-containing protein [Aeromonas hydrophila]